MKHTAAAPAVRARRTARTGQDSARVFAALGDATRLRIVTRLSAAGPLSIAQLTQGGAISRQAITKHLHVLEQGGLLRSERLGRERRWQLEAQRLADVRICLDRISDQWDAAINRLRAFVEADSA
ncbi:MAG TPA: metalloregulator ArsR/SmtB family transcription factor [Solimonas sp.]